MELQVTAVSAGLAVKMEHPVSAVIVDIPVAEYRAIQAIQEAVYQDLVGIVVYQAHPGSVGLVVTVGLAVCQALRALAAQ